MEYNLHRDFNDSFSIAFKKYTSTEDLKGAVDRYVSSQGNQAGLQNLAEILYNMVYNYTPDIADEVMPSIMGIVKQNGQQAGLQAVGPVLEAIFEEGIESEETKEFALGLLEKFVGQNDCQTGLPILVEVEGEMASYTFGGFLKDAITTLAG